MTTSYKGYDVILEGAKEMRVIKDGVSVYHTYHRTVETIRQIHDLIDEIERYDYEST